MCNILLYYCYLQCLCFWVYGLECWCSLDRSNQIVLYLSVECFLLVLYHNSLLCEKLIAPTNHLVLVVSLKWSFNDDGGWLQIASFNEER